MGILFHMHFFCSCSCVHEMRFETHLTIIFLLWYFIFTLHSPFILSFYFTSFICLFIYCISCYFIHFYFVSTVRHTFYRTFSATPAIRDWRVPIRWSILTFDALSDYSFYIYCCTHGNYFIVLFLVGSAHILEVFLVIIYAIAFMS